MSMEAGQTLLHYRLAEKVGSGGMGVVWRATDTTLERDVAIKVLPDLFSTDTERLARFEREAKVLASLNHPNVAAIYGLHQSGAVRFLAMELVPGEDLAQWLSRGRLGVQEGLQIGLGIASALEYAHDRGIVHRDLKPANVKVTPDGAVKVLDFGLAKALDPSVSGGSQVDPSLSPTITIAGTQAGLILGTAAYMSPEQAAGKPVDRRADIWAFGVVLFEILAGRPLFAGETVSHVLAGVLKDAPDWSVLPPDLAPRLRDLLERCLRKDRQRRLQSIGDARVLLEEIIADPRAGALPAAAGAGIDAAAGAAPGRGARAALPWILAGGLAAALVATLAWQRFVRPAEAPAGAARFSISLPSGYRPATEDYPSLAISPDGRRLAIVGKDAEGVRRIVLRDLDQLEPRVLPETDNAEAPFFSPDGEWVGYFAGTALKKVAVAGGRPIVLATADDNNRGATWGPDGMIYLADGTQGPLLKVPAVGGDPAPLTRLDAEKNERTHRWPHVLPGGKALLFTADTFETTEFYDDATITAVDVATGERRSLVEQSSQAQYLPGGHLVYARAGSLFAVPLDPASLRTAGSPTLVQQGVATDIASGAVHFAVSRSSLLYLPGDATGGGRRDLMWMGPDGKMEPAGIVTGRHEMMSLSPEGGRAALLSSGGEAGELWIWIADLSRGTMSRLTFEGIAEEPVWSADGKHVAYAATLRGQKVRGSTVHWKAADGSGEAEVLFSGDTRTFPMSFSPDGRFLALDRWNESGSSDIWILPLQGDRTPRPFLQTPFDEHMAEFSPDGRWLAYVSGESGMLEVYVRSFPGPGGRWQISTSGGAEPRWGADGKALFYRDDSYLYRVTVDGSTAAFVAGRPERYLDGMPMGGNPHTYGLARDGRRVLALTYTETVAAENPTLVLNWAAEVGRLTSAGK